MKREKLQQTVSSEGPQTLGEATKRLTCHDLLVSLVTAFVKDDKPFPDDFSKLVEDLTLHAAALPDDLPDRQKLLDIGLFSKSLASAAGR